LQALELWLSPPLPSSLAAEKNTDWFDILVQAYPGCPGILAVKMSVNVLYLVLWLHAV